MDIYTPENVALQATNSTSFQGIIISWIWENHRIFTRWNRWQTGTGCI